MNACIRVREAAAGVPIKYAGVSLRCSLYIEPSEDVCGLPMYINHVIISILEAVQKERFQGFPVAKVRWSDIVKLDGQLSVEIKSQGAGVVGESQRLRLGISRSMRSMCER